MKNKTSRFLCILIVIATIMSSPAFAATLGGKNISASGACLLDYNTGEILFSHNGDIPRVPASMTKIMTAYCIYDAINNGEISFDTIVPISKRAYDAARNPEYQRVPLYYDGNYTVDELLGVLITYSPIAPAIALAELVGGNEALFVERMNNKVRELGIAAYFYDASGIANNEITPVAMAQLSRHIINDYPDILERTNKRSVIFRGKKYSSTNKLYTTYYYPGADGLKTGTTNASGYCFCGTASRDGQRFIAVAMGASSTTQRFVDVTNMLDYGFATAASRTKNLLHTDIRTFIDGNEVPTFMHSVTGKAVVLAEDLANYGFSVAYNHETRTLTISRDLSLAPTPIPMDYYMGKNGEVAYNIISDPISMTITDSDRFYNPSILFNVNGYVGFYVEELSALYGTNVDTTTNIIEIHTDIAA